MPIDLCRLYNLIRLIRLTGLLLLLTGSLSLPLFARQRIQGWCELGNKTIMVTGNSSSATTPLQRTYPGCTVTVYSTGTTVLSPVFSNNANTVKPNPFTSSSDGFWFFYADNGRYDIKLSGGGMPAPFTISDVQLADPFAGTSSGVLSVFGRTGNVLADPGDYAAYYAAISHTHLVSDIVGLQIQLNAKANIDSPSFTTRVNLPITGLVQCLQVDATGLITGTGLACGTGTGGGGGGVTSVNGRTGVVVLTSADVGLGNVDNTADIDKPVSTFQQNALDTKPTKSSGTGPPSTVPSAIGDIYNDLTPLTGLSYTAFCTTGVPCWRSGGSSSTGGVTAAGTGLILTGTTMSINPTTTPQWTPTTGSPTGICAPGLSAVDSTLAYFCGRDLGWHPFGTSYTLPTPTPTTMGGVMRNVGTTGQFVDSINSDGSLHYATPAGGGGGGVSGGNPSFSFTSQITVTLSHNLGTKNVGVACYDSSTPENAIQGAWSISGTAPYDITMTFSSSQSGRCVVLGGTGKYGQAITGASTYTITGTTHGLGSCDVQVQIWDGSTPAKRVEPDTVTCNSTSKDIVVAFATTQAGRLVIQ